MKACKTARNLLVRAESGDRTAAVAEMLRKHLAACPACRAHAEAIAKLNRGLHALDETRLQPRTASRTRVLDQLRQDTAESLQAVRRVSTRSSTRTSRRVSRRFLSARRRNSARLLRQKRTGLLAGLAAAAALLVAAGLFAFHAQGRSPAGPTPAHDPAPVAVEQPVEAVAALREAAPETRVIRSGRAIAATSGDRILPGDLLETAEGGRAALAYSDGSIVELDANTTLSMGPSQEGKRLTLERGRIFAEVARQPAGRAMVLNPGRHDQVIVVGTAFELIRRAADARLQMLEGRVEFGPSSAAVVVLGGQASTVEAGRVPSPPRPVPVMAVAQWRLQRGEATPSPAGRPDPTSSSPVSEPSAVSDAGRPPVQPPSGVATPPHIPGPASAAVMETQPSGPEHSGHPEDPDAKGRENQKADDKDDPKDKGKEDKGNDQPDTKAQPKEPKSNGSNAVGGKKPPKSATPKSGKSPKK